MRPTLVPAASTADRPKVVTTRTTSSVVVTLARCWARVDSSPARRAASSVLAARCRAYWQISEIVETVAHACASRRMGRDHAIDRTAMTRPLELWIGMTTVPSRPSRFTSATTASVAWRRQASWSGSTSDRPVRATSVMGSRMSSATRS